MDIDKAHSDARTESHLLFLSHAGSDTDAARALAERIENTPEARAVRLKVWFDKNDLEPGKEWQVQLEEVLERESTAFAVYVGSRGVINWVDSEVRLALSRARVDPNYPFIPVLSRQSSGSESLPAFARQYQGVIDVEGSATEFAKLIRAATRRDRRTPVKLVDEPFQGLRAFEEKDTHLFFGRDEEANELVERLKRSRLLMVVGDSGSGKSSLVKAGLVPRYRGGALSEHHVRRSQESIWHVVETRPRSNPFDSLADSVATAARAIGRGQDDIRTLRKMVRDKNPHEVADALRDGSPEDAEILVVIDQFEELFTLSDKSFRRGYIDTILHLAKDDSSATFRVVLTMRRDYYNLCHEFSELYNWLEDKLSCAKFPIRRMSDAQLRTCIEGPLEMAGVRETGVFVNHVLADVGDQPGELALLEMALTESWRRRDAYGGDLLKAYTDIGGTAGALARVADDVFDKLNNVEKSLAEASLIRLVRLGDTGGTTRRVATRDEFSENAWSLLQKLARQDHGRLVYIGGQPTLKQEAEDAEELVPNDSSKSTAVNAMLKNLHTQQTVETAELSHEALVSQWPRYQAWLQGSPSLKRVHDGLMATARSWATTTRKKSGELLTGSRLAEAIVLLEKHRVWLSEDEIAFIGASKARARTRQIVEYSVFALVVVLAMIAGFYAYNARMAETRVREQLVSSYWIQGITERDAGSNPVKAAHYFARACVQTSDPTGEHNARIATETILKGTSLTAVIPHKRSVLGALLNKDESRVLTWSDDGSARVWDSQTGKPVTPPLEHKRSVWGALFNKDESRVLTWSYDGSARVWDSQTGKPVTAPLEHKDSVSGALFDKDGSRVLTWSDDGSARVWDSQSGKPVTASLDHKDSVKGALFNKDESRVLTWSNDGSARVWDSQTGKPVTPPLEHKGPVFGALFNTDESRVLTWSYDGSARVWDSETGKPVTPPLKHKGPVFGALFNTDESRVLTWSYDGSVRMWDSKTGKPVTPPLEHKDSVWGALFNKDGSRVLTWSDDGSARVWDSQTGKPVTPSLEHKGPVKGALLNKDESRVLTWSRDGSARVWDSQTGKPVTPSLEHKGPVLGALFNKDESRVLTWSYDGSARVWDSETGKPVTPPLEHKGPVLGALFNTDESRVLTWSDDGSARVWDSQTGKPVTASRENKGLVDGALFNKNESRVLTWSDDGSVRVWDSQTGKPVTPPLEHKGPVLGALFNTDESRVLTWSDDGSARVWDSQTGKPVTRSLEHKGPVLGALFNTDESRVLTWSDDGSARVWDSQTGKPVTPPLEHKGSVLGALLNKDESRVLTWSRDGSARVWDSQTGKPVTAPLEHKGPTRLPGLGALFNTDGSRVLTWSNDGSARVWDSQSGKPVTASLDHKDSVKGALFNKDESRVLTWSNDGSARVWDSQTGKPVTPPLEHKGSVWGALFNKDESRVLTWSYDGSARVWDSQTGKPVTAPLENKGPVLGALLNKDGSRVLTWSQDGGARVWDSETGRPVTPPLEHKGSVWGALFNKDESRVLTWSYDGSVRVWDSQTGKPVTEPLEHKGPVLGALLNKDGSRVLTWSQDGGARVWSLAVDEKWPKSKYLLKIEVETGTRLNALGELEVISSGEWQTMKREYEQIAKTFDKRTRRSI